MVRDTSRMFLWSRFLSNPRRAAADPLHQRHRTMNLHARQPAQLGEPVFSQRCAGRRRHLLDRREKGQQLGRLLRKLLQGLGAKSISSVAHHALPAEIANAIHNLHGTCSAVRQIAAVEDQVGRGLPQIRHDRLKRGAVAVDVGYDGEDRPPAGKYIQKKISKLFRHFSKTTGTS